MAERECNATGGIQYAALPYERYRELVARLPKSAFKRARRGRAGAPQEAREPRNHRADGTDRSSEPHASDEDVNPAQHAFPAPSIADNMISLLHSDVVQRDFRESDQLTVRQQGASLSLNHSASVATNDIAGSTRATDSQSPDQTTTHTCLKKDDRKWSHEESQLGANNRAHQSLTAPDGDAGLVVIDSMAIVVPKVSSRKRRLPVNQLILISHEDEVNLYCGSADALSLKYIPVDSIEESQKISNLELRGPTAPIVALQKTKSDMARRSVGRCPYKPSTLRHKLAVPASSFLLQYGDGFYGPELQLPAKAAVKKSKKACTASTVSLDLVTAKPAAQPEPQGVYTGTEGEPGSATTSDAQEEIEAMTRLEVCTARSADARRPTRHLYEQLQKISAPTRASTKSASEGSIDESETDDDDKAFNEVSDTSQSVQTIAGENVTSARLGKLGMVESEDLFSQQVLAMRNLEDMERLSKPGQVLRMQSRGEWNEVREEIHDDHNALGAESQWSETSNLLQNAATSYAEFRRIQGDSVTDSTPQDTAQPILHLDDGPIDQRATMQPGFDSASASMGSFTATNVGEKSGAIRHSREAQQTCPMPLRRTPTLPFRPPFLHHTDNPASESPYMAQS